MKFLTLVLSAALTIPALAAPAVPSSPTPLLRPFPLSAACQKAGYTALQDRAGTVRVLRFLRTIPDNSQRLTQYYDAAGRLQSLKASASGFVGLLYTLSAQIDRQGNIVKETGFRSRFFTGSLKSTLRDVEAVKAGHCNAD